MPKSQYPKISIIVPIYNVAPYLSACLDSILAQTYQNLEIILIDDGSTDGSTEIAQKYATQDPRIIYSHQKNSGLSSARNAGIALSSAHYISFVDSDDSCDPTLIEHLYTSLTKYDADLSTATFKSKAHLNATLDTEPALKELFLEQNVTFHAWAKLYKRSLWDDIKFPVGHLFEDVAIQARIFSKCHRIHISSKRLYRYRYREGALLTSLNASKFTDFFRFAEQNLEFIKLNYPTLIPYAKKYLFTATRHTLQDLLRSQKTLSKTTKNTYLTRLKVYAPAALKIKESSKAEKLIAFLALVNKNLPLPLLSHQAKKPSAETYD